MKDWKEKYAEFGGSIELEQSIFLFLTQFIPYCIM